MFPMTENRPTGKLLRLASKDMRFIYVYLKTMFTFKANMYVGCMFDYICMCLVDGLIGMWNMTVGHK